MSSPSFHKKTEIGVMIKLERYLLNPWKVNFKINKNLEKKRRFLNKEKSKSEDTDAGSSSLLGSDIYAVRVPEPLYSDGQKIIRSVA